MGGALYFVTFIDDFSCKVWVYPSRAKYEVLLVFQKFLTLVETQIGRKVKCLRSDNGGEYVTKTFQQLRVVFLCFWSKVIYIYFIYIITREIRNLHSSSISKSC